MKYKNLIIGLLREIEDEKFLKRIYVSLREYVKENNAGYVNQQEGKKGDEERT